MGTLDRGRASRAALAAVIGVGALVSAQISASASVPAGQTAAKSPLAVGCAYTKDLFASLDPTQTAAAAKLAAPNSLALMYAEFQIGQRRALRASNSDSVELVTCKGSTVSVAIQSKLVSAPPNAYSKFKLDKKGRLVDFQVSGQPIAGRLIAGTGQVGSALGVTFKLVAAYRTISSGGDLVVVLDVTGAPDGNRGVQAYSATYDGPAGPRVTASSSASGGTSTLATGATSTIAVTFPSQPIGGTVNIPVDETQGNFATGVASIPIK